ncbi:MAG: ankyrin repeat domain-containing protein [Halanaerobiales bacterium]|nr:ankyrin repeat domain-containing protein [Halanaerobiales bacterium]
MKKKPELPLSCRVIEPTKFNGYKISFIIRDLSQLFSLDQNSAIGYYTIEINDKLEIDLGEYSCEFISYTDLSSTFLSDGIGALQSTPEKLRISLDSEINDYLFTFEYIVSMNLTSNNIDLNNPTLEVEEVQYVNKKTFVTFKLTIEITYQAEESIYDINNETLQNDVFLAISDDQQAYNERISVLVDAGADINAPVYEEYYALISCLGAVTLDDRSIVNEEAAMILLDLGADASFDSSENNSGYPLLYAVQSQLTDAVKYLLEYGADPNYLDFRNVTPFYVACQKGDIGIVKALVDAGADYDLEQFGGYFPLDVAVVHENYQVIKYLVSLNADKSDNTIIPDFLNEIENAEDTEDNDNYKKQTPEERIINDYFVTDTLEIEGVNYTVYHHPQASLDIIELRISWAIIDKDIIVGNRTKVKFLGLNIIYNGDKTFTVQSFFDENDPTEQENSEEDTITKTFDSEEEQLEYISEEKMFEDDHPDQEETAQIRDFEEILSSWLKKHDRCMKWYWIPTDDNRKVIHEEIIFTNEIQLGDLVTIPKIGENLLVKNISAETEYYEDLSSIEKFNYSVKRSSKKYFRFSLAGELHHTSVNNLEKIIRSYGHEFYSYIVCYADYYISSGKTSKLLGKISKYHDIKVINEEELLELIKSTAKTNKDELKPIVLKVEKIRFGSEVSKGFSRKGYRLAKKKGWYPRIHPDMKAVTIFVTNNVEKDTVYDKDKYSNAEIMNEKEFLDYVNSQPDPSYDVTIKV